jgi:hypothetical protein
MLKIGQNLPLNSKTAQHFVGVCAPLEYFDSDPLFKLSVGTLGKIDRSHTAVPQFSDNLVCAQPLPNPVAFVLTEARRRELSEFFERRGVVGEEFLSLTEKCRVTSTRSAQHRRALF